MSKDGLTGRAERTTVRVDELYIELTLIRQRGYTIDDQENWPGIACLALAGLLGSPGVPSGAVSVSTLAYRRPMRRLNDNHPAIRKIIGTTAWTDS